MAGLVVVDASLAVKWYVTEEYTPEADALVNYWNEQHIQMVALHLFPVEVANALHQYVRRGDLTLEAAQSRLARLVGSGIQLQAASHIHSRAMELASELRLGAVYDAYYLALAESLDCELWTADRRFHRIANDASYPVHWVGDFVTLGPQ